MEKENELKSNVLKYIDSIKSTTENQLTITSNLLKGEEIGSLSLAKEISRKINKVPEHVFRESTTSLLFENTDQYCMY